MAHEDHCARQWDQGALDRVWITDFTYLRCAQGWVYLCAVRDAHSRRVLGYAMGEQQSTDLVITALDMAATEQVFGHLKDEFLPRPGLANLRELQSRPQRLHHLLEHNKTPSKAQGPDPGRIPRSGPPTSRITATIKRVQVSGRSSDQGRGRDPAHKRAPGPGILTPSRLPTQHTIGCLGDEHHDAWAQVDAVNEDDLMNLIDDRAERP